MSPPVSEFNAKTNADVPRVYFDLLLQPGVPRKCQSFELELTQEPPHPRHFCERYHWIPHQITPFAPMLFCFAGLRHIPLR